jgi:UDP-N-acetylglucosamine 4,6-dehydratase
MYEFKPNIIVNTAALKTVWVAQDNPYETILTNIVGHQYLIDSVRECNHKIEALMFISTDKACSPINIYGMSKGIAEQMYVNFAKEQTDVKVVLCRYGNVLNSTGSLIPVFKDMIAKGAVTLPITNFEMTRFLITLEEAIDLIEWSYESPNSHGKIVVPLLKSIKIIDFAESIANSCDEWNMKFHKIPIRNGEKLHEEMISSIEYQRVESGSLKYLMIGYERKNEDYNIQPLNSEFHLIESSEAYSFLIDKGVL